MAAAPVYYTVPAQDNGQVTVANTNLDGTGTLVTLMTGSASYSSQIRRVRVMTAVITDPVANKITFFESLDGGTTKRFIADVTIGDLATPSATVASGSGEIPALVGKVMTASANHLLYAATWAGQATNVFVESARSA